MNSLNMSCLGDSIVSIQEEIEVLRQRLKAFEGSSSNMSLILHFHNKTAHEQV